MKYRTIFFTNVDVTSYNILSIDWFWLPIFRTNCVRGLSNKEMKSESKWAVLLQIAHVLISQPRNQNQSIAHTHTQIYVQMYDMIQSRLQFWIVEYNPKIGE